MKKIWIVVCLINFCIAVSIGVLMRLAYVTPMSFNYAFMLHAHSHTVMLGWCYMALYCLMIHHFIPLEKQKKKPFNALFWVTQFSVVGMMLSFPFQGYALFSILFSTIHIFCSYYFSWLICTNYHPESFADQKMLKASLFFMLLSTLGVWLLGPLSAVGLKYTQLYAIAIQFFLHNQFNGWFLFAVLALFFNSIQKSAVILSKSIFLRFYRTYLPGTVLSFAFIVNCYYPCSFLQWTSQVGVLLEFFSLFYLFELLYPHLKKIKATLNPVTKILYITAFSCLLIKILMQFAGFFPSLASASHNIRNFTVGFIHLTMIGIVTSFLFAFIIQGVFSNLKNRMLSLGIVLFLGGFASMELLLFYKGFQVFYEKNYKDFFAINILGISMLILTGLFLFLFSIITYKNQKQ